LTLAVNLSPGPWKEKHMPIEWNKVRDYTDIIFEKAEGIGKITINRPEVRNAFRPETLT